MDNGSGFWGSGLVLTHLSMIDGNTGSEELGIRSTPTHQAAAAILLCSMSDWRSHLQEEKHASSSSPA